MRRGFTLIEIMAVVVLMGLLAGGVAWSLAGESQRMTRGEVVSKLSNADATARLAAKRLGPATLRIDLDTQQVWVVTREAGSAEPRPGHSMMLPPGYRIDEVSWVDPVESTGDRGVMRRQDVVSGRVDLPVSSGGLGRTYVLKLVGPGTDPETGELIEDSEQATWLLVSGLTGQVTVEDEPETIDNLLALLAGAWPDAD